jgi:hypothetical protein
MKPQLIKAKGSLKEFSQKHTHDNKKNRFISETNSLYLQEL